jgi:ribosomal protein S18 acetylase RimI-like enzyme
MICENAFGKLTERARGLKYSSMNYIDFEDCRNAEVLCGSDNLILLKDAAKTPAMLYFAVDDFEALVKIIADMQGKLRLHFVPKEFAPQLKALGFIEWAEFVDFWNRDLAKTASRFDDTGDAEYLEKDDCEEVAAISQRCELQSRGFEGASPEFLRDCLNEGKVIIWREGAEIAGFCCVSIYNEGTTLWLRVIAVDPAQQGRGISKKLMEQAIAYGVKNGAAKSFLAADVLNKNAIGLFKNYDFDAQNEESELQMVRL